MLSDESGRRSALIILLLLPAPLTAIAIMLGLVLIIADSDTVNLDLGGDDDAQIAMAPQPTNTTSPEAAALATISAAPQRAVFVPDPGDAAVALGYDEQMVRTGQVNFLGTCAGCHGTDAHGVQGLGKTLVDSEFVRARSDQELLDFVIAGRQPFDPENTTGILMPPRGGNPGLTDNDLLTIIAYIRTVDGFVPDGSGVVVAAADTEQEEAAAPSSSEPVVFVPADVSALLDSLGVELPEPAPRVDRTGEEIFDDMCGVRYEELFDVPPDYCDLLVEIVEEGELDNDALFTLIEDGVEIWDEDNEIGIHFPARGGYPPLNDTEIINLLDYLGVEGASLPSIEFVRPDVGALLASLGVELEAPAPTPDRDGEAAFESMCGVRYEDTMNVAPDYCDVLLEMVADGAEDDELFSLIAEGNSIWDDDNTSGVHFPTRGGYPPLNDAEIDNLIDYLKALD